MCFRFLGGLGVLLFGSVAAAETLVINGSVAGGFVDISTTGTPLGLDDDGVAEIDPGFDLSTTLFVGDGTGRIWVSNNGAVGFLGDDGSSGAFFLNVELPSFSLFGGAHGTPQALAVYWDDLDSDTGDVYIETIGKPGARTLIIQWQDRPHFDGDPDLDGNEATFQVQILESASPGHAQLVYADVDFLDPALDGGASATIGYQAGGIGDDVQWSFNTAGAVGAGTVLTLRRAGDVDGDGVTSTADLLALLADWGSCSDCGDCPADFDDDCVVSTSDLLVLLAGWG